MKHKFGNNNKEFNYSLNRENNDDKPGIIKANTGTDDDHKQKPDITVQSSHK